MEFDPEGSFTDWSRGWPFWGLWIALHLAGWGLGVLLQRILFWVVGGNLGQVIIGLTLGLGVGLAQWAVLLQRSDDIGLRWVGVTTVGWTVGRVAGWSLAWQVFGVRGFGAVFAALGAMIGLSAGVGQWLILRKLIQRAGWWLPASSVGWAIGFAVSFRLGGIAGGFLTSVLAAALTGGPLHWLLKFPAKEA